VEKEPMLDDIVGALIALQIVLTFALIPLTIAALLERFR